MPGCSKAVNCLLLESDEKWYGNVASVGSVDMTSVVAYPAGDGQARLGKAPSVTYITAAYM
jgi:hypothetical protein